MRTGRTVKLIAILAVVLALWTLPAPAQKQKRSTASIRQQPEESMRLQYAALARIASTDLTFKLTWEAYARLRAGHSDHKLNLAYQKVRNPADELANPKFEKPRWYLLRARTILTEPNKVWPEGIPWQENASNHLWESIHQIDLVVATAF